LVTSEKQALREWALAARLRLTPEERRSASQAIADRVQGLEAFRGARTMGLYAPLGAEVDTAALARAAALAGQRVAYPRLRPGQLGMAFCACLPEALVVGPVRALEPPPGAPELAPDELDLVVVPGVAFDAAGRRIGRGRGHYDSTLAALRPEAARIGLAFEAQLISAVPEEPHDVRLDAVVTEARVIFPLTRRAPSGIPSTA
jgi:5-formyltetrahydrofolate cyclo-ligase